MYEAIAVLAIVAGLAAGTYFVAQSPAFWVGLVKEVVRGLIPVITKRMPPEQEAAWRDCVRRNGKWNHQKRRCE